MAYSFAWTRKKMTHTRRLPMFPRIGIYIDLMGREVSFRHVPFLETMLNLMERGLSTKNHSDIKREQLEEIQFPKRPRGKVIDVEAQIISAVRKNRRQTSH